jgi:hypothetical protein
VKIWIVEGDDFRGEKGLPFLRLAYQRLFDPPNAAWYLTSCNRKLKI